jgi:hypothetical protein
VRHFYTGFIYYGNYCTQANINLLCGKALEMDSGEREVARAREL